ncbi:MAG TPA: Uma2 family endonuclease [Pyrinomonadaceae bacterium]|nr:Uma2 family endonuclease [Pyrinomonadaceae bacterium]HMP66140.1 Uma2 family endonuclease [Pyrinomonadaceae bacterium]
MKAERQSATRNEYINGKVIARSGADRGHNLLVSNTAIGIGSRLHGHKSEIYIGNMMVRLRNNFISYPDIVIVSGEPAFADQNCDLLLNPTLVIEVFSDSTNSSDKTKKLESLLEMQSIKECALVKQEEMRVEHYSRQNHKQWLYRIYNERDDVVSLDSIGCKISLQEIYAGVKARQTALASTAVN